MDGGLILLFASFDAVTFSGHLSLFFTGFTIDTSLLWALTAHSGKAFSGVTSGVAAVHDSHSVDFWVLTSLLFWAVGVHLLVWLVRVS
jgi:hypothetical protein